MGKLDVSVIILSYNTKEITNRCLERVKIAKEFCQKKFGNKIEVIVLDNGSKDDSAQMIKQDHPEVKLIESKTNLGFAKGNNLMMKKVNSPFILLLNSDVYLREDTLSKTISYFRVNLNCDVLGARLDYSDGRLQPSAGNLPNPLNIICWILGLSLIPIVNKLVSPFHPKNKGFFSKAHQVGWVMGAFFALKREILATTHGFDEKLFMHMEEVEWCKRINDKGYQVWYAPQVEVIHLHGASTNFDFTDSFLNELKGIKFYLLKHHSLFYLPVKSFLIVGLILRMVVFSILRKSVRAKVYWKGLGVI